MIAVDIKYWLGVFIVVLSGQVLLMAIGTVYEKRCIKMNKAISLIWEYEKLLLNFVPFIIIAMMIAIYYEASYFITSTLFYAGTLLGNIVSGVFVYKKWKRKHQKCE